MDRPWVRRVRKEPDGRRALAIYLRNARAIFERIAPIMKTVRDAAGSDPEMAAQWQTNRKQTYTAQRTVVQWLADKHALRPELTVDRATDIVSCLVSIEVYQLFTAERGWTPAQWERWIKGTLTATILR
jgi:hypothetical protein